MAGLPPGFDPADPRDGEITFLLDRWMAAIELCQWGAAAEYRQMYLQLLRRKDSMEHQARIEAFHAPGPADPA
jgi:hypothetical protein